ncbi:hypothetical protein PIB30_024167 [Stylosanthes scabra]|uniref:Uncharacterized protein n=1 Tax=Stylosanthes scabra TaxID=79078 RepID=A0ABU6Y9S0_9FABA|nr:hypothetical protein [Stylosanthes scabra]
MDKVTLVSFANPIEQLSRQVQTLVQCWKDNHSSPSKVFKVFGSNSKTPNAQDSVTRNEVLKGSPEKLNTDSTIAKSGPRDIINPVDLPGLELLKCVPVHFKPIAAMGLGYDEVAIAAYLYGNTFMYK